MTGVRVVGYKQSYIRKKTQASVVHGREGWDAARHLSVETGTGDGAVGSAGVRTAFCRWRYKREYKILWTPLLRLKLYALGNYI